MSSVLPASMKVVDFTLQNNDTNIMAVRPIPTPGDNELLIKTAAAGINFPDLGQRAGRYPPPPGASDVVGLEVAGEIVAMGSKVKGFKLGDNVCALLNGGGYAEYATAPAGQCLPVPAGLSLLEAAVLPETFFTVWHNVFELGELQSGQSILIHGGSSGIGTTAIQLAKAFGATVYVTAGSDEKCRFCEELGADKAINYKQEDFVKVLLEHTDGRGVDVILDMVCGDYVQRGIELAAMGGRLILIGNQGGSEGKITFTQIMFKRLTIKGAALRQQSSEAKAGIASGLKQQVWPLLEAGKVKPVIHKVYAMDEVNEAHQLMASSQHIGKLVLEV